LGTSPGLTSTLRPCPSWSLVENVPRITSLASA
jgi:hypothetical protein